MIARARSLSGVLLLICLASASSSALAQQSDLGYFFGQLAAGQGSQSVQAGVVADGMRQLLDIMQKNGNDPALAMRQFVQTPGGLRVMRMPGAFRQLVENFNAILALPSGQQHRP
jgi:hypothetical protein